MDKKKKTVPKDLESKISDHQRTKKRLDPPFAKLQKIKKESWIDNRLPEILWACLATTQLERDNYLDFFRYVAKYVEKNQLCFDVTLSGIAKLPKETRCNFIDYICSWSAEVKTVLRPMLLFAELPAYSDWAATLPPAVPREDWVKLGKAVRFNLWHQSQEATDCRWVKLLCFVLAGKMQFPSMEMIEGILSYPNYGEMKSVRPMIRATELALRTLDEDVEKDWSILFWQKCFQGTKCIGEILLRDKKKHPHEKEFVYLRDKRNEMLEKVASLRNDLITHYFASIEGTHLDSRLEAAFGLALYSVAILFEIIFYRNALSLSGRLLLRPLVESFITFSYLLKKESTVPEIWDEFRSYGTGQLKLIYLKTKESKKKSACIDEDRISSLANEDEWIEFISINLGHWTENNLRTMSEEIQQKEIYDNYYSYTSGYLHSNWAAIRESVMQKCINPLHRLHRLPEYEMPIMNSVLKDAYFLVNQSLDCLNQAYPKFKPRLSVPKKTKTKK